MSTLMMLTWMVAKMISSAETDVQKITRMVSNAETDVEKITTNE